MTADKFEQAMQDELGDFQTDAAPTAKGQLALKRMEERQKKAAEAKARLTATKKVTKPAGTAAKARVPFKKPDANSNFFANAKANKDKASGWAFDFENQDAGKSEEQQVQKALQESLASAQSSELSKSSEVATGDLISEPAAKANNSA